MRKKTLAIDTTNPGYSIRGWVVVCATDGAGTRLQEGTWSWAGVVGKAKLCLPEEAAVTAEADGQAAHQHRALPGRRMFDYGPLNNHSRRKISEHS